MADLVLDLSSAVSATVDGTSREVISDMAPQKKYIYVSSVASWIKQGEASATTAVAAAAGNAYIPAGVQVVIGGSRGAALAVIQAAGAGTANVTRVDSL